MKYGVIAQLVARLNGIQKVRGSNPLSSTTSRALLRRCFFGVEMRIRKLWVPRVRHEKKMPACISIYAKAHEHKKRSG